MTTKNKSVFHTGSGIEELEERERQNAEKRAEQRAKGLGHLFRFWLNKGERKEVIFLNESVKEAYAFYEHNMKGPDGKYGNYEICVKETANCPVCAKHGDSYFVVFFMVLVPNAYVDKKTKESKDSRMLLGIKYSQWPRMKKLLVGAEKKHGTLRGVSLIMARDPNPSQNSPQIGEPEIDDNGEMFTFYDEDILVEDFGNDAILGKDKKTVVRQEDANITVVPWSDIFEEPDVKDLRTRYGGEAAFGSREYNESDDGDEIDMSAPKRGRGRAAPAAEEPQGRRGRASRVAPEEASPEPAQTPTRGRRGRVATSEPEPEAEQDADAAPTRSRRRNPFG